MKRSEMKAALMGELIGFGDAAERVLGLIESAGIGWEPEAPRWPTLARGGAPTGLGRYVGCLLVVTPDGERRPVEAEEGDRIARAWNARRPEGETEEQIRAAVAVLIEGFAPAPPALLRLRSKIEAALRLGVEE